MKLKRTLTEVFKTDNPTGPLLPLPELANLNYKPYVQGQFIYIHVLDFPDWENNLDSFVGNHPTNYIMKGKKYESIFA